MSTSLALKTIADTYVKLSEFVVKLEELVEPLTDEQRDFLFKSIIECGAFKICLRNYLIAHPIPLCGLTKQFPTNSTHEDSGFTKVKENTSKKVKEKPMKRVKKADTKLCDLIISAVNSAGMNGTVTAEIWKEVEGKYKTKSSKPKTVFYGELSRLLRIKKITKIDGIYYPAN
jgi:hypothetical protein